MVALFIGKGNCRAFCKTVTQILKEHCDILSISDEEIFKSDESYKLTVIFKSGKVKANLKNDCVFLNQCEKYSEISGKRYLICDSSYPYDLEIAKKSDGEVITCGLSLRDCVTFSSFNDDRCVISVQRRLTRIDGQKVDPFEFPYSFQPDDDRYGILCAHLLLILLGYL